MFDHFSPIWKTISVCWNAWFGRFIYATIHMVCLDRNPKEKLMTIKCVRHGRKLLLFVISLCYQVLNLEVKIERGHDFLKLCEKLYCTWTSVYVIDICLYASYGSEKGWRKLERRILFLSFGFEWMCFLLGISLLCLCPCLRLEPNGFQIFRF